MYIWASSVAAIWWVLLSRDLSELARRDADGNIRVPVRRLTRRGVGAVIGWNVEKVPRNFEWRRFLWFSGLAEASLAVSFIPWTWLRVVCLVLLSLFAILIWSTMVHDGVVYQKEESRWQGDQDGTVDIKYREEERTPRRKDMLLILIPTVLGLSLSSTVSLAINSTWWRWGLIHGLLCLFVVVLFVRAQRMPDRLRRKPLGNRPGAPESG